MYTIIITPIFVNCKSLDKSIGIKKTPAIKSALVTPYGTGAYSIVGRIVEVVGCGIGYFDIPFTETRCVGRHRVSAFKESLTALLFGCCYLNLMDIFLDLTH
ncbi:hypothetical protein E4K67_17570 [Desulfosporosinus fructosivorans]|uniref:Uncharacterized protein n=1 Tax=Desulfosporosinus fructosivorans TaxID=2018669 RepID=A0A4Z0R4H2_9FIRM|nr:hypothetical protein E4K67_17570 [Desulfosporosinus fructosivorans]